MRRVVRSWSAAIAFLMCAAALPASAGVATAISTTSYPANGERLGILPNYNWIGADTTTIAGLVNPKYLLQVSDNDPAFGGGNIVVSITTPAVVASTDFPTADGAYVSTITLAGGTTYYWRVATVES